MTANSVNTPGCGAVSVAALLKDRAGVLAAPQSFLLSVCLPGPRRLPLLLSVCLPGPAGFPWLPAPDLLRPLGTLARTAPSLPVV